MKKIGISHRIMGNKPQELIDFLEFQYNEHYLKLVAYNKSNGYVKIFTYSDFIEWFALEREVGSLDLTFDEYNEDEISTDKIYKWQNEVAEQQITKRNTTSVEIIALNIEDLSNTVLGIITVNDGKIVALTKIKIAGKQCRN